MKNKIGIDTIFIIIAIVIVAILLSLSLSRRGNVVSANNSGKSSLSEVINRANNADLQVFNAKITGYAGNQKGMIIRALISAVNNSNSSNERQIKLVGGENIDDNATYKVSIDYDKDGYVNTVTIE